MLTVATFIWAAPPKEEVPWKVQLDPLPWKVEPPQAPDKTFTFPATGSVEFPISPSPFCAVQIPGGKNGDPELKMIDLRRMEQVGKSVKDKIDMRFWKVSPWGDHFMSLDTSAEKPTIAVWTVTDQPIASSIVVNEDKTKIEAHEWAGKDRILTVKEIRENGKPARYWQVWDVKTGKEVVKIHSQMEYHIKWIGFSPGRRYLVMQESSLGGYPLYFWDLTTGELAGKFYFQEKKDAAGKDLWGQCGGITFSSDGKEMAFIWRFMKEGIQAKIMRFDMEKGTKKGEHILREEIAPSAPGFLAGGLRTFQFLPDDRGWLVSGHQVVERETGAVVWAFDPAPKHGGDTWDRRFVDNYLVKTDTRGKEKVLSLTALPKADLDAALKKARDKKDP
jgi:hypothetical protein